jgi:osmotically-inducible protein OsmY
MPTNAVVEDEIRGLLSQDPRLPAPDEVAVSATDGAVVLRGTVGSFSQRRAAVSDARKVPGVYDLDDQLQVRLLDDARRGDAEIRGVALQILDWDTQVPDDMIDVSVDEGWLTLTGTVNYQFESDAAYEDVAALQGVLGITNKIEVITPLNNEPTVGAPLITAGDGRAGPAV